MSKTWSHPELGDFKLDVDEMWEGHCEMPAFAIYNWDADANQLAGKFGLTFCLSNQKNIKAGPPPEAIAIALAVIANQQKLAPAVAAALWEDFNDRGPDSGMWWRGDTSEVARQFRYSDLPAPKSARDLITAMSLNYVSIDNNVHGHDGFLAELHFAALFEMEHGVGVLTDGKKILGLGGSSDVDLFDSD